MINEFIFNTVDFKGFELKYYMKTATLIIIKYRYCHKHSIKIF